MLKEKDTKILEEMKTKIKSLPLEERVPAVAIFRLTEQYFKQLAVEEAEEEKLDAEYKIAEQTVLKENDSIVSGQRACTAKEVEGISQFLKEGENCDLATHNVAKPIEEYWAIVLKNADAYMGDADYDALKYLTGINISEEKKSDSEKSVTAVFKFKENPYFTNTELRATVYLTNDMPKTSKGTNIEWKEGKMLTKKKVSKTQKNKKTQATRKVEKEVKCKSIFGLFADFTEKDDEESLQQEEEEQPNLFLLNETIELLNDAIPFSLEYYLGVVDHEDEDEGFEDDDDHDEDQDDDDDAKKPKIGKKPSQPTKSAGGAGAGAGENKEECKKQ
jgi:nucleosome assembly protein 1-like 1